MGSEELILGLLPFSSPLRLRGTFALVVCWPVEVGASHSWRKLMHGFRFWLGCSLATLHWVSVSSSNMASTRLWRQVYIWRGHPPDERTCPRVSLTDLHIAQVSSPVEPRLPLTDGKEVGGGAKKEGQGKGSHSHQRKPMRQLPSNSSTHTAWHGQQQWPLSSPPRSCWVRWWPCLYSPFYPRGKTIDAGYFLDQLFRSG